MKRLITILGISSLLLGVWPAWADWGIPVNLGPPVNTSALELLPVVDPGDTILIFFRSPYIWMSRKISGVWQVPDSLKAPFNPNYAEAPHCIWAIPNGIRLYFSSVNRPGGFGGSDIWYSEMVNCQWSTPQNMGSPINSTSNDNGFRVIQGGARAYITSERTGSRGWHDIWVSDLVSGQWTTPVSLGDSINSVYSDQEPTVTNDDQEMYFWRVGPGMQEPQIFTARKINGVWQTAARVGWPIHWRPYWADSNPYLLPSGNRLYYSGGEDTTRLGGGSIWFVDRVVGVEEESGQTVEPVKSVKVTPNPFTSFTSVPGHATERFALYDISGRRVGVYKGDRIGEGLRAGVYFMRAEGGKDKPVRVVKVR